MPAPVFTPHGSYPRLTLGTATFDAANPAIITPLMGSGRKQILGQAASIRAHPDFSSISVVEWRVDFYDKYAQPAKVTAVYEELIEFFGEVPVLATLRTSAEGGQADVSDQTYVQILTALATTPGAVILDIETARGTAVEALDQAQAHNVATLGSYHDIEHTPSSFDILERLQTMGYRGYDLAKIAVMPNSPSDVIRIYEATYQAASVLTQPVISVAMGPLGVGSRLSGGVFGSAATFATLQGASAPGQVPVRLVVEAGQAIYTSAKNSKDETP
ncbi:type I 3-dehydroquinate dehydratase [Auritidibacter sp. NML130574]|uniref:type I 3-dehydroquinate dehydratase n=1 Tax=Auritidibacter sp. NML130574 TaxID=2170745 RepID=UPI000D73BBB7|nr:type I 3-dehydroquinate dehydratase [Auritidibacter sp. NML130574]AXR73557.1 type I 3-dehydroquinate dehydratase [Auritidibacter sp. NML130574]